MTRDDFGKTKSRIIAERAAYLCSNPECRMVTTGPHTNENKSLKNGVAAHICAASRGGPRYDPNQTSKERSSISNGIWLCHNHSDLVDKDEDKYSKEVLLKWRKVHLDFVENEKKHNYSTLSNRSTKGGDGGKIFIFAKEMAGDGKITVDGGDGRQGGNAGNIHIETQKNDFTGDISAKGGKSIPVEKKKDYFEDIYIKSTGAQLRFLEVLRESMRIGGKGMDCGYVSRYFINVIGSKTDRYHGWITPFITAYIQERRLVTVSNNFFSLTQLGEKFLDYIKSKGYQIQEKEL